MTLHVLIVSDVRVVQEGLQNVLEQQAGIASISTSDVPHAVERCEWVDPDVILFDAAHGSDPEQLRRLVAAAPRAKVAAFGTQREDAEALAPTASGAVCCVSASAASEELVRVLERISGSEPRSSRRAADSCCREALSMPADEPPAPSRPGLPLSRRELEIARLIDRGLTNKEIARELGIETATVKNHVHNLCEKLCVHRRGQATARIRALLGARIGPALLPTANAVHATAHGSG
jgi:two-component system, NarL family, nitrate/nitrite response regulator NarL